ncbi:Spore coat protein [Bacillus sp. LK2]|nr:Spore coat protein [Bacillus sp. LK2]
MTVRQEEVDFNFAFGTFKNVQIGSSSSRTGEPSHNTTTNTRSTAQLSSSMLSTRKIEDVQCLEFSDGANALKGSPSFVYKIKGRVFATTALLCAPKNGISHPDPHVVVAHSCSSCIKRTTLDTQLKSKSW